MHSFFTLAHTNMVAKPLLYNIEAEESQCTVSLIIYKSIFHKYQH